MGGHVYRKKVGRYRAPYWFIAPFFIMFMFFMIGPLFYAVWLSFSEFRGGLQGFTWVGLQNYISMFHNARFLQSIKVTLIYLGIRVPLMIGLATVLALVFNIKGLRGRGVFRLCWFLPVLLSYVAAALIFQLIYDYDIGIINILLRRIGLSGYKWILDPALALPSLIALGTWKRVGYFMVIILAGLQNVPEELYDAAAIDGANTFQIIWHVTLPLIFPVIFFCIIISSVGSFQFFDETYVLTGGGPADTTLSIALYLYQNGFQNFKIGYASAVGFFMSIVLICFSIIQIKILGKKAALTT